MSYSNDDVLTHGLAVMRGLRWTSQDWKVKVKVAFGGSGWATIFANSTEQEVSDTLSGLGIVRLRGGVFSWWGVVHAYPSRTARRHPLIKFQ